MSQDAKLAYLNEKIKDARRGALAGYLTILGGGAAMIFLDMANIYLNNSSPSGFTNAQILGIIIIAIGLIVSIVEEFDKQKTLTQLRLIARGSLKCLGCGKELNPDANLSFCPYCGKKL